MTFGDFIREKRIEKGFNTKASFARAINVSPTYVADIEKNRKKPSYKVIIRMEKALEIPRDVLIEKAGYDKESSLLNTETEKNEISSENKDITGIASEIAEQVGEKVLKKIINVIEKKDMAGNSGNFPGETFLPVKIRKYPVISPVIKSSPENADLIQDWIYLPDIYGIDADFVIVSEDSTMEEHRIFQGMLIFVKKQSDFSSGDIVVIFDKDKKSSVLRRIELKGKKRLFFNGKGERFKFKKNMDISGVIVYSMFDPRKFCKTEDTSVTEVKKVIYAEEAVEEGLKEKEVAKWNNRGIELEDEGKYEEAIWCFDKALEIDPEDAVVLIHKAFALEHTGKFKEAGECYNKALELEPEDEVIRHNRDSFLESQEDEKNTPEGRDTRYWYNLTKDSLFDYEKVMKMYNKYKN